MLLKGADFNGGSIVELAEYMQRWNKTSNSTQL